MIEKPKVLKCTLKVLENRSTFEMYLSTSTSTEDFPEMYLSTFQVLYKLYLSTDVLKYKVLMPGSGIKGVVMESDARRIVYEGRHTCSIQVMKSRGL